MDLSAFPCLPGNYIPVAEERDLGEAELRVESEVPANLVGAYMRDGANPASDSEEGGRVMCFGYNPGEGAFLSILNAGDFSRGPVARVHIPGRVPNGFHGNWMNRLSL